MSTDLVAAGRPDVRGDLSVARPRADDVRSLDRLPKLALDYLQLVGPAILAAIAAVSVMAVVDDDGGTHLPRRRRVGRPCWPACSSPRGTRNLLLGLVVARRHRRRRTGRRDWRSSRALAGRSERRARSRRSSRIALHSIASSARKMPRRPTYGRPSSRRTSQTVPARSIRCASRATQGRVDGRRVDPVEQLQVDRAERRQMAVPW